MRIIIVALVGVFMLTACGPPGPALENHTPDPVDDVSTIEAIASSGPSSFEPPPPLSAGTFSQLMPTSINEVVFEDNEVGDFSVIGALEVDGLIYIYLHNGSDIFYAVSSNGSEWALSPEPVFTGLITDDFEYYPTSIHAIHQGFAIYLGAATIDYAEHNYLYSIWTLSAPEPTGPWTLSESPSLIGYAGQDGYALFVSNPIVRPYLDGFRMYYAYSFSIEGIVAPQFAAAHSWDGLFWRYTSDLPTQEMADGVNRLGLATEYDWSGLLILDIWPTEAGWQMLYLLDQSEEGQNQIYLADSEDGLQWAPSDIEIRLPIGFPADELVSASTLFYEGRYLLTYCSMPQPHSFQCYIAASDSGT